VEIGLKKQFVFYITCWLCIANDLTLDAAILLLHMSGTGRDSESDATETSRAPSTSAEYDNVG